MTEQLAVAVLGAGGRMGSEAVKAWTPAYENYTFNEKGSRTELAVDMDVLPDYEAYMTETWPKALAKLKEISEAGQERTSG